ncbi:MAG: hypothetical protein EXR72_15460 [Myxococcales bacterium]|nr:hypothetical protein [Myxococcales bacterium]
MSARKRPQGPEATPIPLPPADVAFKGGAALKEIKPLLDLLPASEHAARNLPVTVAAQAVIAVAQRITGKGGEEEYRRFKLLPKELFDIQRVDFLERVAWATLHVAIQADAARGAASMAKLPRALVDDAKAIEERMQKCCEYYFDDDPVLGPRLALLRPGSSYEDLASDLVGYHEIYLAKFEVVRQDAKHFRESDLTLAPKRAEEIFTRLGEAMTPEALASVTLLDRVWTLLSRIYTDVARTGSWINRFHEDPLAGYPSLFDISRASSSEKKEAPPPVEKPA